MYITVIIMTNEVTTVRCGKLKLNPYSAEIDSSRQSLRSIP